MDICKNKFTYVVWCIQEAYIIFISDNRFVNVEFKPGDLIYGGRYVICIRANATVLHHEFWNEELPDINTCSDGVTVDTYPPVPAEVWLYEKGASYQVCLN